MVGRAQGAELPGEAWRKCQSHGHIRRQDDAKEETTVSTLIERVPIEEILEAKKEEAERQKLKAKLSRQMNTNDLFDLE